MVRSTSEKSRKYISYLQIGLMELLQVIGNYERPGLRLNDWSQMINACKTASARCLTSDQEFQEHTESKLQAHHCCYTQFPLRKTVSTNSLRIL